MRSDQIRKVAEVVGPTPEFYALVLVDEDRVKDLIWITNVTKNKTALEEIAKSHNDGFINLDTGESTRRKY